MIKVGVTGGIGAGKTTFCETWENLGAYVVYADDFAKNLMITDNEVITQIRQIFGEQSYLENGDLNTGFIANQEFNHDRVNELNSIIHPVLWKKINELAFQKEKDGVKIFVKEAAILLQKGRPNDIDYVILLDADQSNRIERVKTRDNTTSDLVVDRMNKQQKFSEVKHLADFIVFNNEGKSELEKKANELYKILISKN